MKNILTKEITTKLTSKIYLDYKSLMDFVKEKHKDGWDWKNSNTNIYLIVDNGYDRDDRIDMDEKSVIMIESSITEHKNC